MKIHAVIRAIVTSKSRVTKAIMLKTREIVHIFGESELCVYNSNSFTFVYVRFRSVVGATYLRNRREKK